MTLTPIAYFRSPLPDKFGIPRQSGLVPELKGRIELVGKYAREEALRGLEGFDYIWLIWEFDRSRGAGEKLTVRPPRLGGNTRMGVFATRSPFRPNPLGLSSVKVESIDAARGVIEVSGADLADGTPVYDIKPYLTYADSHPGARSGFAGSDCRKGLEVMIPPECAAGLGDDEILALKGILAQDPRPSYHDGGEKEYGLAFAGRNFRFRVEDGTVRVISST